MDDKCITKCAFKFCMCNCVHTFCNSLLLLQFLWRVSLNSEMNKMDRENLAIIMTPNIMPITVRKISHCGSLRVNQHIEVLQVRFVVSYRCVSVPV